MSDASLPPFAPPEKEEIFEVLLGNPFRDGLEGSRRELRERGALPEDSGSIRAESRSPEALLPAWKDWWRRLSASDDRADRRGCGLALVIGSQSLLDEEKRKEVVQLVPAEVRPEVEELAKRAGRVKGAVERLKGKSAAIQAVRERTWRAALGHRLDQDVGELVKNTPVLVLGETGTGKELVTRALREAMASPSSSSSSARAETVHLASIPESLIESALFGHVKGAFTGAHRAQEGVLRRCNGGTVVLDEVAELPTKTQVALLRVLQERKLTPVGGRDEVEADVRIVSATHRPLEDLVHERSFREDLYYRLSSIVIRIPPLRERREDIEQMVDVEIAHVPTELQTETRTRWSSFSSKNPDYSWPGNVRELSKALRALALGFEPELRASKRAEPDGVPAGIAACKLSDKELRRWYAKKVMAHHGDNLSAASRTLDVQRNTLRRLLEGGPRGGE